MTTNPYSELGEDDIFGMHGIVAPIIEAVKKCGCAGIPGRAKSTEQDLNEAAHTIERAIKMHKEGKRYYPLANRSHAEIERLCSKYQLLFGGDKGISAMLELLYYENNSKLFHLTKALNFLNNPQ